LGGLPGLSFLDQHQDSVDVGHASRRKEYSQDDLNHGEPIKVSANIFDELLDRPSNFSIFSSNFSLPSSV
jgi:hypothetical protein